MRGIGFTNLGFVAMSLVADTVNGRFRLVPESRLGQGVIVS